MRARAHDRFGVTLLAPAARFLFLPLAIMSSTKPHRKGLKPRNSLLRRRMGSEEVNEPTAKSLTATEWVDDEQMSGCWVGISHRHKGNRFLQLC
jgi:hypothetical protein